MRTIVFDQWDELAAKIGEISREAVADCVGGTLAEPAVEGSRAALEDRAMNSLTLSRDAVLALPEAKEGRPRELLVRVESDGAEHSLAFEGAEAFESGEEGALDPPGAGETVVYMFTEVKAGRFLVARKAVKTVEMEG